MSAPMDPRRARIAKLHIAKAQLAMEDAAYRALLHRITGKDTSAACSEAQLDELLAEMKRLGFQDSHPWKPASSKPHVRMIYVLWKDLRPYVDNNSREALRRFVQRQTRSEKKPDGVNAPEFLSPAEGNLVIEGLKSWLARERAKAAE